MTPEEKIRLLRSVRLLSQIPESRLEALERFLSPLELKDGTVIFEEGEPGDSLFFVARGQVRISKRVAGGETKDLALLSAGECFGEMALVEETARFARATARGATTLFRLHRQDMSRWLKSNPELAVDFFAQLVKVFSERLRRTSSEFTLVFDLSRLALEPFGTGQELLSQALPRIVMHLEGSWSAAAFLHNMFNDEMELAASCGPQDISGLEGKLPTKPADAWLDDRTYYAELPRPKKPHGHLLLRCENSLNEEARAETGRALSAAAHLLASALENITYRIDESLRQRLKEQTTHGAPL